MNRREHFLKSIDETLNQRAKTYGPPKEAFDQIARRWSITLGKEITPQEVALCMIDLKLSRLSRVPGHVDTLMDIIGYALCCDEIENP